MLGRLRAWAKRLKREVLALWLAARDPRTPLAAKLVAGAVAAYALSPLDLIPDAIPILGLLDDLVLLPLGVALALALVPRELMAEFRLRAAELAERPVSRWAMAEIVATWILSGLLLAWTAWRLFGEGAAAG